jgi:hypothetical protein
MTTVTSTAHCPHWCARDHSAEPCGTAFYHASETSLVTFSGAADPGGPERVDVQTAQYLPDDPGEPAWSPRVELAVHTGGRYRLIGLTPGEARELATLLARAADMLSRAGAPPAGRRPAAAAPRPA